MVDPAAPSAEAQLVPRLSQVLRHHVTEAGVAPSASLAVALPAGARGRRLVAVQAGRPPALAEDDPWVFDLASVSKPFLALAVARQVEAGSLQWAWPLVRLLPSLAGTAAAAASLEDLLAHRSGLAAHRQLWKPWEDGRPLRRSALLRQAARARGDRPGPVYSDLGYLLVGAALERVFGPLDELVSRSVTGPLGLAGELGSARQLLGPGNFLARVLPTETVRFRGGRLRGVVHDENAWALAGFGFAGHAGLFGTARALARLGGALLDVLDAGRQPWLSRATLHWMLRERPDGSQRVGFDGRSQVSSASELAGPRTFGHLGFTGTSLWCDPDRDVAIALLTNRVCPTRQNAAIRAARPAVHRAAFELLDAAP